MAPEQAPRLSAALTLHWIRGEKGRWQPVMLWLTRAEKFGYFGNLLLHWWRWKPMRLKPLDGRCSGKASHDEEEISSHSRNRILRSGPLPPEEEKSVVGRTHLQADPRWAGFDLRMLYTETEVSCECTCNHCLRASLSHLLLAPWPYHSIVLLFSPTDLYWLIRGLPFVVWIFCLKHQLRFK